MRKNIFWVLALLFLLVDSVPTCDDNYQLPKGLYAINIKSSLGETWSLTIKNAVVAGPPLSSQFMLASTATNFYAFSSQEFYIQPSGTQNIVIKSSYGSQTGVMDLQKPISSTSDWEYAVFNTASTIISTMFMQNCSDGSVRIYTISGGNRAYLGMDPGTSTAANAYFGATYWWSTQLTYLYISYAQPKCSDGYKGLTPGWYNIGLSGGNGRDVLLTLPNPVTSNDYEWAQFMNFNYATSQYPGGTQSLYIQYTDSTKKFISINANQNLLNWLTPNNPISSDTDYEYVQFADLTYIQNNPNRYSSSLQLQNCSDGSYRIYTTFKGVKDQFGGNRGYLGIDPPPGSVSSGTQFLLDLTNQLTGFDFSDTDPRIDIDAKFGGIKYPLLKYLTFTPLKSLILCNDTILPPGRYSISAKDYLDVRYNFYTKGIVNVNDYQWNKALTDDDYQEYINNGGSKQFWVESGTGNIHYFRGKNIVGDKGYLTPKYPISSSTDWQYAILADQGYLNANSARTKTQLYVQTCYDSTFRIYTTFTTPLGGLYKSYLGMDSPWTMWYSASWVSSSNLYFAGDQYSGQIKQLNIQMLPTYDQTCQSSDQIDTSSVTFYMTADPLFNSDPKDHHNSDAMKTYDFLVNNVKNTNCKQTFIGILGGLQSNGPYFDATLTNNPLTNGNKGYFFADVYYPGDIITSPSNKYSLTATDLSTGVNPFYWTSAISIPFYKNNFTLQNWGFYQSTIPTKANYYALGLYNTKTFTQSTGQPIAYYLAIQYNLYYGGSVLTDFKNWYNSTKNPYQSKNIPIILVSYCIEDLYNRGNGTSNLDNFAKDLNVAAILQGQRESTRKDSFSDISRTSQINGNGKNIPIIQMGGAKERIFFSISLNANTVKILRRVWTNSSRLGNFETPDSQYNLPNNTYTYK